MFDEVVNPDHGLNDFGGANVAAEKEEIAVVIVFNRVSEIFSDVLNDILIRQVVLRKIHAGPLSLEPSYQIL